MVRKYCNPNKMNCLDKKIKNKKTYLKDNYRDEICAIEKK